MIHVPARDNAINVDDRYFVVTIGLLNHHFFHSAAPICERAAAGRDSMGKIQHPQEKAQAKQRQKDDGKNSPDGAAARPAGGRGGNNRRRRQRRRWSGWRRRRRRLKRWRLIIHNNREITASPFSGQDRSFITQNLCVGFLNFLSSVQIFIPFSPISPPILTSAGLSNVINRNENMLPGRSFSCVGFFRLRDGDKSKRHREIRIHL
jgi:hypothetical protein